MSHKTSTLVDFVADYIDGNFSVRPDTLDMISANVRMAVIELQKQNMFPETTISFQSIDLKDEKRDSAGRLIYNYYTIPDDFRQLYNNGPAFEVEDGVDYHYVDYTTFLRIRNTSSNKIFTIHQFNGEYGKRTRLIAHPFPEDTKEIHITYYSNGVDMEIDTVDQDFYMPVIDHVLSQLGIKHPENYQDSVNKTKQGRNNLAGQGSHHGSFARTKPRFFGKHR